MNNVHFLQPDDASALMSRCAFITLLPFISFKFHSLLKFLHIVHQRHCPLFHFLIKTHPSPPHFSTLVLRPLCSRIMGLQQRGPCL